MNYSFLSSFSFYINNEELAPFFKNLNNQQLGELLFFSNALLNLFSYFYILVKFYKVLCYAKMTCDWFPMLNPYEWPFSFLGALTTPYFRYWAKILPSVKFQKSSVEISGIIGLEVLNAFLYFCVRSVNILHLLVKATENSLIN